MPSSDCVIVLWKSFKDCPPPPPIVQWNTYFSNPHFFEPPKNGLKKNRDSTVFLTTDCLKKSSRFVAFSDHTFSVHITRPREERTPSLAVAAKVLPLGIFAHHLVIILIKFELIRYVVKEERLCGTTLNKDGLYFAPTALRITWNAP